jgi:hypothetical protein
MPYYGAIDQNFDKPNLCLNSIKLYFSAIFQRATLSCIDKSAICE